VEPEEIIKQLKGISCHQPAWHNGGRILSCSDAIAKAIEKYRAIQEGSGDMNQKPEVRSENSEASNPRFLTPELPFQPLPFGSCPECGGAIEHEGGCAVCRSCGFTKCS
jgi:ribonucleoside-diphosphate reductase alpha chain